MLATYAITILRFERITTYWLSCRNTQFLTIAATDYQSTLNSRNLLLPFMNTTMDKTTSIVEVSISLNAIH